MFSPISTFLPIIVPAPIIAPVSIFASVLESIVVYLSKTNPAANFANEKRGDLTIIALMPLGSLSTRHCLVITKPADVCFFPSAFQAQSRASQGTRDLDRHHAHSSLRSRYFI